MIVLQVNNLSKSFVTDEILSNVKLEVQHRDRVALVGRNGAGKSTLLKIIAGQMSYDAGEIIIPKDIRLGYLEQHTGLESTLTIWDEMMTIFEPLKQQEKQLRALEAQMADPTVYEDEQSYTKVMAEYDQLQHNFKDAGGYQYESDTRSVLHGMQFFPEDYDKLISTLSGGQRTRLALAKLLLSKPDLLILDEPTNHLDIETLNWLENYLKGYDGAILIVSHDRYFLDQIVNIVYEVSRAQVKKYVGHYSAYLEQKAKDYERDLKLFERQQDEKAKLEAFIQKNIARASTTKMAQSRRKILERKEWLDAPDGDEKSASFGFTIEKQSGNDVLSVDELSIGYNEILSNNISLRIFREDRIALVGPNGVGKSTLLKTIVKDLPIIEGNIRYGTNVQIGYYDQEQAKLTSNKTVLQELWDEWPLMNEKDIRTILGRFLFSGDDVAKTVNSLSGGEKARLALAKLMMQKANFLVLDEPTNHLDLDSKEVLENALIDYPGTLLFVSHDRYFINRIATKVVELSSNGTFEYLGDYDYYIEKKQELEELAQLQNKNSTQTEVEKKSKSASTSQIDKDAKKRERQIRRAIEEIEKNMDTFSDLIEVIEKQLCDPAIFPNHEKVLELQSELDKNKEQFETLEMEWLELNEELENLTL